MPGRAASAVGPRGWRCPGRPGSIVPSIGTGGGSVGAVVALTVVVVVDDVDEDSSGSSSVHALDKAMAARAAAMTRPHPRRTRIKPSCTTVTARWPSWAKMLPRPRPRPPDADGVSWSYRSHSSAREGPVEPHGVVEAGHHQAFIAPDPSVGAHCGVEQRHVARVGDDARVEHRIVREHAARVEPHLLERRARARFVGWREIDVAHVDGPRPAVPGPHLLGVGRHARGVKLGSDSASATLGIGGLKLEAVFGHLEAGLQVEDGLPVLDGDHVAGVVKERPSWIRSTS